MSTLIETKLRPPRLREVYVIRPRLLTQLDHGLGQGIILISARQDMAKQHPDQRPDPTAPPLAPDAG